MPNHSLPSNIVQVVLNLYKEKMQVTKIAEATGVSVRSIYNIINDEGLEHRVDTGFKTSDEKEAAIVQLFVEEKKNFSEIAAAVGDISQQTVSSILRKKGLVGEARSYVKLDARQRLSVVDACVSGDTVEEVATRFNVGTTTVARILRANGVSLTSGRPPTHAIDHDAFDVITPASAYWMGFLFADGCVHEDVFGQPYLICALAEKDRAHLEKLRAFLKSEHPLSFVEKTKTSLGGPCVRWGARSSKLCGALRARGIVAKKLRVPVGELIASRDFWRGMIDGDGSLGTIEDANKIYPHIRLYGQIPLLECFQTFLASCGIYETKIVDAGTRTGSVFGVQLFNVPAGKLIEILYKNDGETHSIARANARKLLLLATCAVCSVRRIVC